LLLLERTEMLNAMFRDGGIKVTAFAAVAVLRRSVVAAGIGGLLAASLAGSTAAAADPTPQAMIENVPVGQSVYRLRDSAGHSMDTAKIVADPTTAGRYLAVYHWLNVGTFNVGVATSKDLRTWTYRRTLDSNGSQPDIAFSPKKGPIIALEGKPNDNLRFRYWTTVSGMLGATAAYRTFDVTKTLSACAEGTPDITEVAYARSSSTITSGSTITVSHHYFAGCKTDRQAAGTLRNFGTWTTATLPTVDERLTAAGAQGKHGDRDTFSYQGKKYTLFEGSVSGTSFSMGDWRNYLYDGTTATQLSIRTARGSTAFANPAVTVLNDPAGVPSLLVTQFIPSEGAAPGEGGTLLYWQPINPTPPPPPG
jgi:hypothetical protein